ncbi:vesicle-associated membrane protein 7-like isoform X2 [Corticium candelabrum]|uniref:vesicle-associated membrane protein 7-like isoform X2 n=1 Tax=Corticium candelabrum TaxID=121492 RepID=UPI002E26D3C6|nr:vesicle-associated membrane protein 7-like isoform X2 [Corticium candelabrum]
MPIIYSLISRSSTVLCEHSETTHIDNISMRTSASQILASLPSHDTEVIYSNSNDEYLFHVVVSNGIKFMCLTDCETSQSQAFGFLFEIRRKFNSMANVLTRTETANPYELNKEFADVLAIEMRRYSKRMPKGIQEMLDDQIVSASYMYRTTLSLKIATPLPVEGQTSMLRNHSA